jgi:hypothetical protein
VTERDALFVAARDRVGLSDPAVELLLVLDVRGEVAIEAALRGAFDELATRGLAEARARLALVRDEASARPRAIATVHGRAVMHSLRQIVALETMARSLDRRRAERAARGAPREQRPRESSAPLTLADERAILDDALAWVDASPTLPAASDVRITLRLGPRFVRVFWASRAQSGAGSILHFVERRTGRIYRAKSWRQVGRPTSHHVSELARDRERRPS